MSAKICCFFCRTSLVVIQYSSYETHIIIFLLSGEWQRYKCLRASTYYSESPLTSATLCSESPNTKEYVVTFTENRFTGTGGNLYFDFCNWILHREAVYLVWLEELICVSLCFTHAQFPVNLLSLDFPKILFITLIINRYHWVSQSFKKYWINYFRANLVWELVNPTRI